MKISNSIQLRVRYAETDKMGVVYYGNYAQYFEVGRVELMRSLGIVYDELEKEGVMMPVVHYEIDYKTPAKYDEELTVITTVEEMPTGKMTFLHEVHNPKGALVCKGKVVLVFINNSFRPTKAPQKLLDTLSLMAE